ncbi:MAG: UbiA family prenyltransferase [Candidatus Hermodarchaeota archaeon]
MKKDEFWLKRVVNFILNMRLHIGVLFAVPNFFYGLFVALALSDWQLDLLLFSIDRVLGGIVIALTYLPFVFVINDYFDAPYDALNPKKCERNFFCNKRIRNHLLLVFLTIVLPIACMVIFSCLLGLELFILTILVLLIGFFYSAPPFRLKEMPIADFASHGIYVGSYFFLIGATAIISLYNLLKEPLFLLLMFFTWVDGAQLHYFSQLLDYDIDYEGSQRTTSVWLGRKNSLLLLKGIVIVMLLCLPLYFYLNDTLWQVIPLLFIQIIIILGLALIGVYLWQVRGGSEKFEKIVHRSAWYRIYFVYPFALLSILLITLPNFLIG